MSSHSNDRKWQSAPDGSYEIILSPEKPANVDEANWIELTTDAQSLITRHYFLEKDYCPAARGWQIPIEIEPLADPGPRPEPSRAEPSRAEPSRAERGERRAQATCHG